MVHVRYSILSISLYKFAQFTTSTSRFGVDAGVQLLCLGELGEACFKGTSEKIIKYIARPVPKKMPTLPFNPRYKLVHFTLTSLSHITHLSTRPTGLFKLPYEILEMIFPHTTDHPESLIAFLMCNKTLYLIGYNFVQELFCKSVACGAGNRIICLGDNCKDVGLPDGILPEDLEKVINWEEKSRFRTNGAASTPRSYVSFAIETFQTLGSSLYLDYQFYVDHFGMETRGYSQEWVDALIEVTTLEYPPELDWILCNLTKRVYVTAKAISKCTGIQPRGPFFDSPINLAEILMFKVCCSTDPSCAMAYSGPLHQGAWAADRIEIATMDRLAELKPVKGGVEKDWEDVSGEEIKKIVEIAKSEYPNRWEDMITNPIRRRHGYLYDV